ncbi:MAG: hypothetical protein PHY85_03805 [Bacteroidales bacterium]|jgi:hypothetical protein|nr:hypothetical protein [Bacteroidales bacterium]
MKRTPFLIIVSFSLLIILFQSKKTYGRINNYSETEIKDSSLVDFSKISQIVRYPNGTKNYSKIFLNALNSSSYDPFIAGMSKLSGFSNYSIRGYERNDYEVVYDGIVLNRHENAMYYFPNWIALLGLNNTTGEGFNHNINRSFYSGIFGAYELTSSHFRHKKTSFSWTSANHLYRNSFHAVHSTGEMNNGWSITISGSGSWANEGYVESTAHSEWSYFFAAKKTINQHHDLSFTIMGTPIRNSQTNYAPQEAFNLRENNYYSPNFGYQEGKLRNENQFTSHIPIGIINHSWKISDRFELNSSFAYSKGSSSFSELEWNDAYNPSPTYYRNMPSYYSEYLGNETAADYFTNEWLNNPDFYQINWHQLYFENRNNLYQIDNANGIMGNSIIGNRAKYYLALNNRDMDDLHLTSTITYQLNSRLTLVAGVYYQNNQQHFYKTMDDLLGADFHLDILNASYYLPELSSFQSDLNQPNRTVSEGEQFAYDYIASTNSSYVHALIEYKLPKIEITAFGSIGGRSILREGQMENEAFKTNSLGSSETYHFGNYNFRGETKFWAHENHSIQINGFIESCSPDFYDLFVLPQVSNVTANYANKTANGISFGYKANTKYINATFNAYKTNINNQNKNIPYFDEVLEIRGTVSLEGLNQVHEGIELGVDYKLSRHITFNLAAAHGKYYYSSRPNTSVFLNYLTEPLVENETSYVKNFRVPNIPQTLLGIGIAFQSSNNLFFELRGNYYDNIFSAFSYESRTALSTSTLTLPESEIDELMKQSKLAGGGTLDISFGKGWSVFNKQHNILFCILVTNALDNQNIVIGGFESGGYLTENRLMSQHKYMYMYGRSIFVNLLYQF